jgi:hypothetical protein
MRVRTCVRLPVVCILAYGAQMTQPNDTHGTRDKVNRLRTRIKNAAIDPLVKAIMLGMLDLLEDEL